MSTFELGAQIAGLRVDELIARTGSSEVYRGVDTETGSAVAIKVLARTDDSARRRLRREADLLASVDHPLIVPFHSLLERDDHLVLVTGWVDGTSLRQQAISTSGQSGHRHRVDTGLALLDDLASPLDYLHRAGIVHRDISPGNIIIDARRRPVLVDLGIGHTIGSATLTNNDLMAGTPKYLAPEIIRGESATGRADQYSLAVVLYEWIAGRSPFPASDEIATALHHQLTTQPEPLIEVAPSVPAGLSAALERALAKDPVQRFDSVADFARAARSTQGAPGAVSLSPRRSGVVAMTVAAIIVLFAAVGLLVWPGGTGGPGGPGGPAVVPTTVVDTTWPVGSAALLACNLLQGHGFETGSVPVDYFANPPARERVVVQGGYGNTAALQVGFENLYGQFGEIIPITTGEQYVFRAWFNPVGDIQTAEFGIAMLDANSDGMDLAVMAPVPAAGGFAEVRFSDVPAGAVYAVPYLYKANTSGVVLADEMVFGLDSVCGPEMAAMVGGS